MSINEKGIIQQIKDLYSHSITQTIGVAEHHADDTCVQYIKTLATTKFKNNTKAAIYAIMHDIYDWPKCCICGNDVSFNNGTFKKTCSIKCAHQIVDYKTVQQRREHTCLQKYGVKHNWSSEKSRNKCKETCKQRYGVESYSQTQEFKDNNKRISQEKYNTDHIFSSPLIRQQIKDTCLQKYGVPYHPQDESTKMVRKNTMQTRYGVSTPFALPTSLAKQQNWRNKTSYDYIISINTECEPLFTYDDFISKSPHDMFLWKCKKCGHIFEHNLRTRNNGYHIVRCEKCMCGSYMQQDFQNEILKYAPDAQFNIRNIISPKELDIHIPSKHLAIEFNGVYWHNTEHISKTYHLDKKLECDKHAITLIHIWDCDYFNKSNIILDRIKHLLGCFTRTVFARKCQCVELSYNEASNFIEKYHLQGADKSKIYIGLKYENDLISVMSFNTPRFNKQYQYELVRFVNKSGYNVIGGAGKLLKYFERHFNPTSIITYADKCWSNGNLYKQLGFIYKYDTPPGYFYCKNNKKYSRYECQKHKLKNILKEKFDKTKTETQNMLDNQFVKVYDCGNMVFIKTYD